MVPKLLGNWRVKVTCMENDHNYMALDWEFKTGINLRDTSKESTGVISVVVYGEKAKSLEEAEICTLIILI